MFSLSINLLEQPWTILLKKVKISLPVVQLTMKQSKAANPHNGHAGTRERNNIVDS